MKAFFDEPNKFDTYKHQSLIMQLFLDCLILLTSVEYNYKQISISFLQSNAIQFVILDMFRSQLLSSLLFLVFVF